MSEQDSGTPTKGNADTTGAGPVLCLSLLGVIAVLVCLGCSDPNARTNDKFKATEQSGRVVVVSAQQFYSSDGNMRDILVLRDTETGKEYLAVGGCGVTDMRVISTGKTTTVVEE